MSPSILFVDHASDVGGAELSLFDTAMHLNSPLHVALMQDGPFADLLRSHAVPATVVNAGVSGDTTAGGLARLDWALAERPHAALVELGGNDGLRGLPPRDSRANLAAILDKLASRNIPALLAGMVAPPNLGTEYGREFLATFADLARERPEVAFYPFFLDGVAADPALNQPDGIHPNARGVEEVVRRILPAVETLLARVSAAPAG